MWILFAFGSALFAGITSVLAKCGLKNTDSHVATAIRTTVVLLFAWLLALLTGGIHTLSAVTGRSLLFLLLSGLATGGSWLCYFRALQLGDVNKVTPVDKTSTVLTMLLAALFLGETLSPLKWVCLFLILLGTWAMIGRRDPDVPASHAGGRWFPYALVSAFLASITSLLGKVGMEGIDSNLGTAIRTVVVLLMAWGIVLATGKGREIRNIDSRSWGFLLLSGLATGISWLCYFRALQEGPASVVVPIDKLSIVVTIAFSSLFLREELSPRAALGLVALVAGTLLLLVP